MMFDLLGLPPGFSSACIPRGPCRKAIPPENLPVDYGGAAAAVTPPSVARPQPARPSAEGAPASPSPRKRSVSDRAGSLLAAVSSGGRTSYVIGGRHAIALVVALWGLLRRNVAACSAALWALALALAAREWVGASVTIPSSNRRVPLLHDYSVLLGLRKPGVSAPEKAVGTAVGTAGGGAARGARDPGDGSGGVPARGHGVWPPGAGGDGERGAAGMGTFRGSPRVDEAAVRRLSGVRLEGSRVEITEVVGNAQGGFTRFCVKVRVQVRKDGAWGGGGAFWAAWALQLLPRGRVPGTRSSGV